MEPLPIGKGTQEVIRKLRAIDAEIFGNVNANSGTFDSVTITNATLDTVSITNLTIADSLSLGEDFYSSNWDGTIPLSLPDAAATLGFALDGSAGTAQFNAVTVRGTVESTDITIGDDTSGPYVVGDSNGFEWRDNVASPLEDPAVWPYISTAVDGDTLGSFPADTNMILEIASASWSGNDDAWIRLGADNYSVSSVPTILMGTGTRANVDLAVGPSTIDNYIKTIFHHANIEHRMENDWGKWVQQVIAGSGTSGNYTTSLGWAAFDDGPGSFTYYMQVLASWNGTTLSYPSAWFLADQSLFRDGSASSPSITFSNDSDTGMFRNATNDLGFATANSIAMRLTADQRLLVGSNGAAATPSIAFNNDSNTGFYRSSSGVVRVASDGNNAWGFYRLGNSHRLLSGGSTTTYLAFDSGTSQWQFHIGGTQEFTLGTTGFLVPNVYNYTPLGSTANVEVTSTGLLRRVTSALKYKTDVVPDYSIANIDLTPVSYRTLEGKMRLGLIADWVAEQDSRLGEYGPDGEVENYDTRGVIAVLAAKIEHLEARIKELEDAS